MVITPTMVLQTMANMEAKTEFLRLFPDGLRVTEGNLLFAFAERLGMGWAAGTTLLVKLDAYKAAAKKTPGRPGLHGMRLDCFSSGHGPVQKHSEGVALALAHIAVALVAGGG